jgi:hypothetical protein
MILIRGGNDEIFIEAILRAKPATDGFVSVGGYVYLAKNVAKITDPAAIRRIRAATKAVTLAVRARDRALKEIFEKAQEER